MKIIISALTFLTLIVTPAIQSSAQEKPLTPPKIIFEKDVKGANAVALATQKGVLATLSATAGLSEQEFKTTLETDDSSALDRSGAMYYVEPVYDAKVAEAHSTPIASADGTLSEKDDRPTGFGSIPSTDSFAKDLLLGDPNASTENSLSPGAAEPASSDPAPEFGPFPAGQTFFLNSKPGSSKTIYLDFDGYVPLATSAWTTTYASGAYAGYQGPRYDTDGNPLSWSTSELDTIQSVWQRVSEDFAPFDVNVTTQDPGLAAIDRTDSADTVFGTTVAFVDGPTICGSCGGVAYLNVFSTTYQHQNYQPAWVFSDSLYGGAKSLADAASHEVGHNFGLGHDGCSGAIGSCPGAQGYYRGHSNWAPLMGVGYYEPVSQWSKGEYLGADSVEDDVAIIASQTPYIADESNSSLATASYIGALYSSAAVSASGLINGPTPGADFDFFRFHSPTSKFATIDATPASVSPNLDIELSLMDQNGNVLAISNPTSGQLTTDVAIGLSASISIELPYGGWYYLRVRNAQTDANGDVGYTYYGSQGRYSVSVSGGVSPGDSFWPVAQSRLLDTRPNPVLAASQTLVTVAGVAGVPVNATAVSLNVTAVTPAGPGHLRVFPAGTGLPMASVLNFATGKNTPNRVIVKVGTNGQIVVYTSTTTNVLVDISGYWLANSDHLSQYQPVSVPTRIFTTTIPAMVAGDPSASTVTLPILGQGGIPTTQVTTAVLNLGAINPTAAGHLRVFSAGSALPPSSTNNFVAGDSRMNLAQVNPGIGGAISVYNGSPGPVTLTVDSIGWFWLGGLAFKPIDPIRPIDTRTTSLVAPGDFREVQIRGFSAVPNSLDVQAVVVNIAAVTPTAIGSIDAGPSGSNPTLPTFTHPANENVANLAILKVGADGKIRIRNNSAGSTHIIADIAGYFTN